MKILNVTKKLTAGSILVCIMSACAALGILSPSTINKIQYGMTQQQVKETMKCSPDYRRFSGKREEWEYRGAGDREGYERVVVVAFENGRVTDLDSFSEPIVPKMPILPFQSGRAN